MKRMVATDNKRRRQFSLRSMLMGLVWLGFIMGICVQYQRAVAKQRAVIETLKAAGIPAGIFISNGSPSPSNP